MTVHIFITKQMQEVIDMCKEDGRPYDIIIRPDTGRPIIVHPGTWSEITAHLIRVLRRAEKLNW